MPDIKCFMLQPTDRQFQWLRRYTHYGCKDGHGHRALTRIEDGPYENTDQRWSRDDPRWPKECQDCNLLLDDTTSWQLFSLQQYRREDTGEIVALPGHTVDNVCAPVGAMWYAPWYEDMWFGPDKRCLVVRTPGGEWVIDSVASNCTRKDDKVHKCWVRHGTAPAITVDKNGNTCAAGAGSILCGNYHGFLRNGYLVDA